MRLPWTEFKIDLISVSPKFMGASLCKSAPTGSTADDVAIIAADITASKILAAEFMMLFNQAMINNALNWTFKREDIIF
jgi:hypothetical protein